MSERLEDRIELRCCGRRARLRGNMSLREAGADRTELMYTCVACHRSLFLADGSAPVDIDGIDSTP